MLLFGTKPVQKELPHERQVCPTCLSVTDHSVVERELRVMIYFIPLFSVRHEVVYTCLQCGDAHTVTYQEYQELHPEQAAKSETASDTGPVSNDTKTKRDKARVILQGRVVGDEVKTSLPWTANFNSDNILKWFYIIMAGVLIIVAILLFVIWQSLLH